MQNAHLRIADLWKNKNVEAHFVTFQKVYFHFS
jgi:hypothetical protein